MITRQGTPLFSSILSALSTGYPFFAFQGLLTQLYGGRLFAL